MARKRVEVEVPDGTRLGFAQDPEGGMRGLLFDEDTGRLVGHANLFEYSDYEAQGDDDDDDDDDWGYGDPRPSQRDENIDLAIQVLAQVLTNLVIHGAERAAPHVRDWWNERAVPSLKEKAVPAVKLAPGKVRAAVRRRRGSKASEGGVVLDVAAETAPERAGPGERAPGIETAGPVMGSSEAQQRLIQAVAATAFAREQMALLRNATIVDDDGGPPLAALLADITPQHLETAIRAALDVSPLLLDRPNLSAFTISLGTGRAEVDPVPLERERALPGAQEDFGDPV